MRTLQITGGQDETNIVMDINSTEIRIYSKCSCCKNFFIGYKLITAACFYQRSTINVK